MSNLKEEGQRHVGGRSNTPTTRSRNTRPQVLQVHQQTKHEQESNQEDISIGKGLNNCLPIDPKSFLFVLVAVVYLIIGVIHFAQTGDTSMLTTLLGYAGGYIGLEKVTPLFSRGKERGHHL
jgi:hypothetical protein